MIHTVSTVCKRNRKEATGLQHLTVCWGAEYLGERAGTLSFHIIHFRKHIKKNFLKWLKLQKCP
jgi:hypothetical protein